MSNEINRQASSGVQLPEPVTSSMAESADEGPALQIPTADSSRPSSNPNAYPAWISNDPGSMSSPALPPAFLVPPQAQPLLPKPIVVAPNVSQANFSEQRLTRGVKISVYVHLGLSMAIIVLSVVDLNLHNWVQYCGPRVSLMNTYSDDKSQSLRDVKNVYCSANVVNLECGDVCGNLKRLIIAGQVMLSCGVVALVLSCLTIMGILYVIWCPIRHWCGKLLRGAYVSAALLWIVGTMAYVGLYIYIHDNTSDSSTGPGLQMAIALMFIQIINMIFGNIMVNYTCSRKDPSRMSSRAQSST